MPPNSVYVNDLDLFTLPLSLRNFADAYGLPVWHLQLAATSLSVVLRAGGEGAKASFSEASDGGWVLQMAISLIAVDIAFFWLARLAFQRENLLVRWR